MKVETIAAILCRRRSLALVSIARRTYIVREFHLVRPLFRMKTTHNSLLFLRLTSTKMLFHFSKSFTNTNEHRRQTLCIFKKLVCCCLNQTSTSTIIYQKMLCTSSRIFLTNTHKKTIIFHQHILRVQKGEPAN